MPNSSQPPTSPRASPLSPRTTRLHSFHTAIVGATCESNPNLRMEQVEAFLVESRSESWVTIIRGDAWMMVMYAACTDPWSMIRKKATTAYASIIGDHAYTPTAIALPLSKLLSHDVATSSWYVLDGALLLTKNLLASTSLRPMLVSEWELVTVPILQGLLKPCLSHIQLSVRTLAAALVASIVADIAPVQVGVEYTSVILEHTLENVQSHINDSSSPGVAIVEGALGMLLAFSSMEVDAEIKEVVNLAILRSKKHLAFAAIHEAATIRFALAEIISKESLSDIDRDWMAQILDCQDRKGEEERNKKGTEKSKGGQQQPQQQLLISPSLSWRAQETIFLAVGVHLKIKGGLPTEGDDVGAAVRLFCIACASRGTTFEEKRAVGQAIPLLAHVIVSSVDSSVLDYKSSVVSSSTAAVRALAWSAAIRYRLATHKFHSEVNTDLAASARNRNLRRIKIMRVPLSWTRWVEDVAGADPVVAVLFACYGIAPKEGGSTLPTVDGKTWNLAIKFLPRAVLDAIAYGYEATTNRALGATLDDVVTNSWAPLFSNPASPVHMQCILCDALIVVCTPTFYTSRQPFPHLQHNDYKPPVLEDGGSDTADGTTWITQALVGGSVTASLASSRSSENVAGGNTETGPPSPTVFNSIIALTPQTMAAIAAAVRKVVVFAGTEPSVINRAAHLASLLSSKDNKGEGVAFGAVTFFDRLVKLFPNYKTGEAHAALAADFDDSDDDWDASEDEGEAGATAAEMAAGICVTDEIQRVRRQVELKGLAAMPSRLRDELSWFVQ